jgi:uncharacterized membrane protein YdjX (TVP38/TMEM64 family)
MKLLRDDATSAQVLQAWTTLGVFVSALYFGAIITFVLVSFVLFLPRDPNAALVALLAGTSGYLGGSITTILGSLKGGSGGSSSGG